MSLARTFWPDLISRSLAVWAPHIHVTLLPGMVFPIKVLKQGKAARWALDQHVTFWVSNQDTQMLCEVSAHTNTWYLEKAVSWVTDTSLPRQWLLWHLPPHVSQAEIKRDAPRVLRAWSRVFNNWSMNETQVFSPGHPTLSARGAFPLFSFILLSGLYSMLLKGHKGSP